MNRRRGWVVAARALLFLVCSAVLLATASRWVKGSLMVACSSAIATLLLTVLFVRWDGARLRDVGAAFEGGSLGRFAVTFVIGLSLPLLRAGLVMIASGMRYERAQRFAFGDVMMALALYIALASREELAFRGYSLRVLDRQFGPWVAQAVIAVLFAAEHALGGWTWRQAVFGSGVGALLFGAASLRTRGLAVPIGLHAAWNFGDAMLGGKGMPGLWQPVVKESAFGRVETTQWVSYVLVMIAAAVAIWLWPGRRKLLADVES